MGLPRASGILLHPTSLPGRFGVGDLGPEAHAFVRFLADTGQRWWQILPLGPTGFGNSPYQSYSSHAGNPLLISPGLWVEGGGSDASDPRDSPELPADRVDFDLVAAAKEPLFRRAFGNFQPEHLDFATFLDENAHWLDDYALYMAIKEEHGGAAWYDWEADVVTRQPETIARMRRELAGAVQFYRFVQYAFARQWQALRKSCAANDVKLIGDLPIFVAQDSADVWARPDLFQL